MIKRKYLNIEHIQIENEAQCLKLPIWHKIKCKILYSLAQNALCKCRNIEKYALL